MWNYPQIIKVLIFDSGKYCEGKKIFLGELEYKFIAKNYWCFQKVTMYLLYQGSTSLF